LQAAILGYERTEKDLFCRKHEIDKKEILPVCLCQKKKKKKKKKLGKA